MLRQIYSSLHGRPLGLQLLGLVLLVVVGLVYALFFAILFPWSLFLSGFLTVRERPIPVYYADRHR